MNGPRQGRIVRLAMPPRDEPEAATNWDASPWAAAPELAVDQHMGAMPAHFPRVRAKLGWDAAALYVAFRVEDRYVRAVAQSHQDAVCTDSCVEFFFCPGLDIAKGYFNLEMNCGGTVLFNFQVMPRRDATPLSASDLSQLTIARSLPRIVDPEIQEPVTWFVECRVPFAVLQHYLPFALPHVGDTWRGNLYKCGDNTSHPHWLTWSPINRPRPDFHVPDQFGRLTFQ